jgi:hypothetical protein
MKQTIFPTLELASGDRTLWRRVRVPKAGTTIDGHATQGTGEGGGSQRRKARLVRERIEKEKDTIVKEKESYKWNFMMIKLFHNTNTKSSSPLHADFGQWRILKRGHSLLKQSLPPLPPLPSHTNAKHKYLTSHQRMAFQWEGQVTAELKTWSEGRFDSQNITLTST